MPSCQNCRAALNDPLTLLAKICPFCGQPLVVVDDGVNKPITIANFPDCTIDLGTASSPSAPPPSSSSESQESSQTLIHDSTYHSGELPGPKPGTIGNFPNQTLDSTAFPQTSPSDSNPNFQTIEHDSTSLSKEVEKPSGDSQGSGQLGRPRSISDRRLNATMDSGSAGGFDAGLSNLWGKSSTPSSPYVTMRGSAEFASDLPENSTLVIRERALRGKTNEQVHFADYDLIEVLGEGGMGVVYTARQASVDREVALKMLRPEMLDNANQRRKFLSEAVVTGELDHPNIVPIYDVGQNADGALFYSMKKVQGTPWSKMVRTRSLMENLGTLMQVADAVAFAHARGVIHRDLKPENVMLGDFGEVLVLDWGLAVATEGHRPTPNVATEFGIAGTPAYMSPELAMGPLELIGKASDIYLLGAILYEIITGKPPHQGKNAMDCLKAAARNEIVPTEKEGELIEIALTAMRTEISDRYPTVQAFQEAVREYQSHSESISLAERAHHDLKLAAAGDDYRIYARALLGFEEAFSLWSGNESALAGISRAKVAYAESAYRKGDYDLGLSLIDQDHPDHAEVQALLTHAKRERDARQGRLKAARRVMLGLVALVFLAITVGIVLTTLMKVEADKQRDIAKGQKAEAELQRTVASKERDNARQQEQLAINARRQAEYEAYVALISMAAAKIDENAFTQAAQALAACQTELRGWEWGRLQHVIQQGAGKRLNVPDRVECVATNADGSLIAVGSRDGTVRVWELNGAPTGRIVYRSPEAQASIQALAFSPVNDKLLAIGSNVEGKWLQLLNLATDELKILDDPSGHRGAVVQASFSRDGGRLLTASHDHTAKLWDIAQGKVSVTYQGHSWLVWSAVFSHDQEEKYVATASEDGTVRLWETLTGREFVSPRGEPLPFAGHRGPVYSVVFLPPDPNASTAPEPVNSLPNLGYVASAGYDKRVLLWQPHKLVPFDYKKLLADEPVPQTPFIELIGHTAAIRQLSVAADGRRLLSASNDNSLRLWYTRDEDLGYATARRGDLEKELRGHDGPVQTAVFLPGQSDTVVSAGFDRTVRVWDVQQYNEEQSLPARVLRGHVDAVMAARFSHDSQSIFTASRDRTAKRWSLEDSHETLTFREGHAYLTSKAIFFPDGERLLTSAVDGTVRVWDARHGAELLRIEGTGYRATTALSPDGAYILTGSDQAVAVSTQSTAPLLRREGAILWDAKTGQRVRAFAGHKVPVTTVAFSGDGSLAFTGDGNGVGYVWKVATAEQLAKLEFHRGPITAAIFLAQGQRLLTSSIDGTVAQWDIHDLQQVTMLKERTLKVGTAVNSLAITADGARLLLGGQDGTMQLWNVESAEMIWSTPTTIATKGAPSSINAVAISPQAGDAVALGVDSLQHKVHMLDLNTGREILVPDTRGEVGPFLDLRAKDALGWSATFSPDGNHIVTVGGDEARMWDRQGVEVTSFGPHRPLTFIDVSADDQTVVTAGWDNTARLWNARTAAPLITLDGHVAGQLGPHSAVINCATFSPDTTQVLTGSDDNSLRLWDVASGRVVHAWRSPYGSVTRAVWLRDGKRLVISFRGNAQGAIAGVWNLADIQSLETLPAPAVLFKGHAGSILDLAISGDERYLVTGSADNTARVWELTSGQLLYSLEGHSGEVTAVAFAPGQLHRRVLTGSSDRTGKIWDVSGADRAANQRTSAVAKELLTLRGHTRGITSVAFSQDGSNALTASRDGLTLIWGTTTPPKSAQ